MLMFKLRKEKVMYKIFTTVSVIAIMGATSAFAQDVTDAPKEAYKNIKSFVFGKDPEKLEVTNLTIDPRATASHVIGKPIYNNEERVGTVKDIILDNNGKAVMVVVADGEIFGLGKLVAFEYSDMVKVNNNDNVMMTLTEDVIDQAAEFSYEQNNSGSKVRVIPSNGYSLNALLDGELTDIQGKTLAQIDDVSLKDGKADHLILGFDKILGIGGEKVAIKYDPSHVVMDDNEYDFQLTSAENVQFNNYKKTVTK